MTNGSGLSRSTVRESARTCQLSIPTMRETLHSLWSMQAGEQARIECFDEALPENYRIRLMELGFHTGEAIQCVQSPALGAPKVYRVANTIYALDDSVAEHISVSPQKAHE